VQHINKCKPVWKQVCVYGCAHTCVHECVCACVRVCAWASLTACVCMWGTNFDKETYKLSSNNLTLWSRPRHWWPVHLQTMMLSELRLLRGVLDSLNKWSPGCWHRNITLCRKGMIIYIAFRALPPHTTVLLQALWVCTVCIPYVTTCIQLDVDMGTHMCVYFNIFFFGYMNFCMLVREHFYL